MLISSWKLPALFVKQTCWVHSSSIMPNFLFFSRTLLELYKNTTAHIIHLYFSVVCQRGKDLEMWFKTFCLNRAIYKYNPELLCNSVTNEIKIKVWNSVWKHSSFSIQKGCWFHILFRSPIVLPSIHLLHSWVSYSGKSNWKVTVTREEELGLSRIQRRQEFIKPGASFTWE